MKRGTFPIIIGLISWIILLIGLFTIISNVEDIISNQITMDIQLIIIILLLSITLNFFLSCIGVWLSIRFYKKEAIPLNQLIISIALNGIYILAIMGIFGFSLTAIFDAMMGI